MSDRTAVITDGIIVQENITIDQRYQLEQRISDLTTERDALKAELAEANSALTEGGKAWRTTTELLEKERDTLKAAILKNQEYYQKDVKRQTSDLDKAIKKNVKLEAECERLRAERDANSASKYVHNQELQLAYEQIGLLKSKLETRISENHTLTNKLQASQAECERLRRVIVQELSENDELGCEYTYVNALRAELKVYEGPHFTSANAAITHYQRQVRTLTEALRWYADVGNYGIDISHDEGLRARAALATLDKTNETKGD